MMLRVDMFKFEDGSLDTPSRLSAEIETFGIEDRGMDAVGMGSPSDSPSGVEELERVPSSDEERVWVAAQDVRRAFDDEYGISARHTALAVMFDCLQ